MKPKSFRKLRRLNRKVREAELRVNTRIRNRMDEMMQDKKLMEEIDAEIEKEGGAAIFLERSRQAKALPR